MTKDREERKCERVIVCGGRDYKGAAVIAGVLERVNPLMVVQGGYRGADALAERWAEDRGVDCVTFHANWHGRGNAAGPYRNGLMLKFMKPDLVIAFPGGTGTANMVRQARAANVKVYEVPND